MKASTSFHLTLIRHAKSSWDNPNTADYYRPLNTRGYNNLPEMTERIIQRNLRPSLCITSGATRAQATAKAVHRELRQAQPDLSLVLEDDLYEATPEALLRVIQRQDNQHEHLMLFGHNPGMHQLIELLTAETLTKFPTCGIMHLSLTVSQWSSVCSASGSVLWFDYPKLHKG